MLGNGSMLVGLNEKGLVHDFYFPYVGQDNLANARSLEHLVGVWADNQFSWLKDDDWQLSVDFETEALVSKIEAQNDSLGVKLEFSDFMDSQYTAFCRRITVTNLGDAKREIRLFMHQVFLISHRGRGDTVLFNPAGNYLYDYKGRCAMLISARDSRGRFFDQYSVGNFGIEGKEGTFRDAEDGQLEGNLVEHGSVDSVLRVSLSLGAQEAETVDYWIIASFSQYEAEEIHNVFCREGLHSRLDNTRGVWRRWLSIGMNELEKIDEAYRPMACKSLMLIKAHIDNHGGIIASGDSSIYNYGRDYYSYVWPRDGALTMLTLMKYGYHGEAKRFFEFCIDTINPHGYMMHKYQPDRSIGSTWHPLMHRRHPELAIQEDETALVICALYYYFQRFDDPEFLERAYSNLIKPSANFMAGFIDDKTSLPHASYDLWEERFGTHTFTVAVTERALLAASSLAEKLNHQDSAQAWHKAAKLIDSAFNNLYSEELGHYRRSQYLNPDGQMEYDDIADISSIFGVMEFGGHRTQEEPFKKSVEAIAAKLYNQSPAGGVVRYEHDNYFLKDGRFIGNPWIICTLWLARYYIHNGQKAKAKDLINWSIGTALPSGALAEQVDPENKSQVGVSPLVWSHAELADTLLLFSESPD